MNSIARMQVIDGTILLTTIHGDPAWDYTPTGNKAQDESECDYAAKQWKVNPHKLRRLLYDALEAS